MAKFVTIGERLSTTAPAVNKAFTERDPEPIISSFSQSLTMFRLHWIQQTRKLSKLVFLYTTEQKENQSLTLQTQVTEFPISTLQQQMMQSVSHFAPLVW